MTSQTARFAGRKAGARRKQPGPGAYDTQGKVPDAHRDFNRASVTAVRGAHAPLRAPRSPAVAAAR